MIMDVHDRIIAHRLAANGETLEVALMPQPWSGVLVEY